jgi:hypothetical protein
MSPPHKIVNHRETASIVHTLSIQSEDFTMTTLAKSKIDDAPEEGRSTELEVTLSINDSSKAWFKESRANGKVESSNSGSPLNSEDLKTFKNLWFSKWKPRIEMTEVYKIAGQQPPEKLELSEDYKTTLSDMKE